MKGLIKAGKFNIKFTRDYVHKKVSNKKTGESELVKVPVNTCAVIFDEKGNALSSGVCSCYFKDHFTKEKGGVIALKRVMELLSLQKEERTKIWNAYHSR